MQVPKRVPRDSPFGGNPSSPPQQGTLDFHDAPGGDDADLRSVILTLAEFAQRPGATWSLSVPENIVQRSSKRAEVYSAFLAKTRISASVADSSLRALILSTEGATFSLEHCSETLLL